MRWMMVPLALQIMTDLPEKASQRQVQVRQKREVIKESWEDSETDSNTDKPHVLPAKIRQKEKQLMQHTLAA